MDGNSIITQVARKNATVADNDVEIEIEIEVSNQLKNTKIQDCNGNVSISIFSYIF
jgi:hypothetical protein